MSMDMEELVRGRLEEARRMAEQWRLVAALKPARRPLRVTVGMGLIHLGRLLVAQASRAAGAPSRARA